MVKLRTAARSLRWALGSVGLLFFATLTAGVASLSVTTEEAHAGLFDPWRFGGHDLHNTRNAAGETTITPDNVGDLVTKWVFTTAGDVSATPTVVDNALYFPDWGGFIYKLNASTGARIWSHHITDYTGPLATLGAVLPVSRTSPAIVGEKLIVTSQSGAWIMAVNRTTGNLIWKTRADTHPYAIITQSPVAYDGRVYVGVSSLEEAAVTDPSYTCCSFRGSFLSLDLDTGHILWRRNIVPPGYSGGAVWGSTPVIDVRRRSVYITTGNNYTVPPSVQACADAATNDRQREACTSPNNHIDSVMSLSLDTGAIKWRKRLQGFDIWTLDCLSGACVPVQSPDYDFAAGANLFTISECGFPRQLLGAGQKSGVYWAFDPDDGSVVWGTRVGPGSPFGGLQWGSAVDGERVYVASANNLHASHTLEPSGQVITWGSFGALDAVSGDILWQIPDPIAGSVDLGMVTIANGVMFVGSTDSAGHFYALDGATGAVLWDFASGGSTIAGPAVVNGTVYWGSGYNRLGVGTGNNKLYAFGLP